MASTYVGVIISKSQKVVRRVIDPDNDFQLDDPSALLQGEEMHKILRSTYNSFKSFNDLANHIMSKVGPPHSDRCVIVNDKDVVIAIARGDPNIDGDIATLNPGEKLIQHNAGKLGEQIDYKTGQFSPPTGLR